MRRLGFDLGNLSFHSFTIQVAYVRIRDYIRINRPSSTEAPVVSPPERDAGMRIFAPLFALCLVVVSVAPRAAAPRAVAQSTCQPFGPVIGAGNPYDWIANGEPASSACWTASNASFVTGTTTCGSATNAWQFNVGTSSSVSQQFTIPADWTADQSFDISYYLDFVDPNNDGTYNRFAMEVIDVTAGNTILASDYFDGYMGDLSCSYRVKSWPGNLAGHTLKVNFRARRGYSNTAIRVRMIRLYQY